MTFGGSEEVPVPADRVMTCLARAYLSSGYSSEEYTWDVEWTCPDGALIADLESNYGKRPRGYEKY
jgi:hypothetical protein